MTFTMPCTCKNDFQDKEHGKGMRVHNPMKGGEKARCTVCLNERFVGKKEVKK